METINNDLNRPAQDHSTAAMWVGSLDAVRFDPEGIKAALLNLNQPCFFLSQKGQLGATNQGYLGETHTHNSEVDIVAAIPPLPIQQLGDRTFLNTHGVSCAYAAGAMANGIASEALVIALGQAKFLSSFGAAGLLPDRIEAAIHTIQSSLPHGPYAFNLIHSPSEPIIEQRTVNLYLKHGIRTVEASAFLDLTPNIVRYRVAGLNLNPQNQIEIHHKVIAKVSRQEVAAKFMQPAPRSILKRLLEQGQITELQATLADQVPMADDITAEADSGGHTDNRPLTVLLPSILSLRDRIQATYLYPQSVRIGAAGGIGTPHAALAAFMMGAAYIVTGSINQSCVEAGASAHTKDLLSQAEITDMAMAPAADMFEMGVKLQVLKRGTFFPMRSQHLYKLYTTYQSIDEIPEVERLKLEKQVFRATLDEIWNATEQYFLQRDPEQVERAKENPKRKMALIFRWYLGLSSRWSNLGEPGREIDYQIWCGPAMGAFNEWVKGSYLENLSDRRVVDVAHHIMTGAAYLYRLHQLKLQELSFPPTYWCHLTR